MKLMYLSQDAIDDIKVNFKKYRSHFTDKTNEWFMKCFQEKGWIHESKFECKDFSLDYDSDTNVSDRKNIETVYEAMIDLNPANALDERLWAGMLFGQLWDYVKYRRADELKSGEERKVLNSFFFLRGTKRSCFMNCLSRLWWTGFLLYDKDNADHYGAVNLICDSAYASNILLFSSNNFASNKNIALGVLDCIAERKRNGEKINRYHYVEANKGRDKGISKRAV
jgi:hypothetical protein